jgi:hypothetical protein
MGDAINLRRARKKKARERSERAAEGRRAQHGVTKLERARAAKERARRERVVDGARRAPGEREEER